jgi:hypothetical protein
MRTCLKNALFAILIGSLSPALFAQSDICEPPMPSVPQELRGQLLQLQAEERARRAAERSSWVASILPVKYATSTNSLRPLCIFGIEVAPQPTMKLVGIRAPKELMPAIEEALKRLDVALPVAKSIELTAYILVVAETPLPGLQPIPATLQSVANQLKSILPNGTLYLADTAVGRGIEGQTLHVTGTTNMTTTPTIREGADPVVHLERLNVSTDRYFQASPAYGAAFATNVDVPVGGQVVVGKATATSDKRNPVVLVMTARILD